MGAGEIGCYASHLEVISGLLAGGESARVILEDDGILSGDFAKLLAELPQYLPDDWDIVFFTSKLKHPWPASLHSPAASVCFLIAASGSGAWATW